MGRIRPKFSLPRITMRPIAAMPVSFIAFQQQHVRPALRLALEGARK